MKKMLPLFAGIALLASVSTANASEPMQLTTAQMDNVAAGTTVVDTCKQTTACSSRASYSNNLATATAVGAHVSTTAIADENSSYASSSSLSP